MLLVRPFRASRAGWGRSIAPCSFSHRYTISRSRVTCTIVGSLAAKETKSSGQFVIEGGRLPHMKARTRDLLDRLAEQVSCRQHVVTN